MKPRSIRVTVCLAFSMMVISASVGEVVRDHSPSEPTEILSVPCHARIDVRTNTLIGVFCGDIRLPLRFDDDELIALALPETKPKEDPESSSPRQFRCRSLLELQAQASLILIPPANEGGVDAEVILHGRRMDVNYRRAGLTEQWYRYNSLSIELTPDLMAKYEDGQGGYSFFRCSLTDESD